MSAITLPPEILSVIFDLTRSFQLSPCDFHWHARLPRTDLCNDLRSFQLELCRFQLVCKAWSPARRLLYHQPTFVWRQSDSPAPIIRVFEEDPDLCQVVRTCTVFGPSSEERIGISVEKQMMANDALIEWIGHLSHLLVLRLHSIKAGFSEGPDGLSRAGANRVLGGLEELSLSSVDSSSLAVLEKCLNVKTLGFQDCEEGDLTSLVTYPVQHLVLEDCPAAFLPINLYASTLETLDFNGYDIELDNCLHGFRFPRLTHLRLWLYDWPDDMNDPGCLPHILKLFPNLQHLTLINCPWTHLLLPRVSPTITCIEVHVLLDGPEGFPFGHNSVISPILSASLHLKHLQYLHLYNEESCQPHSPSAENLVEAERRGLELKVVKYVSENARNAEIFDDRWIIEIWERDQRRSRSGPT